MGGLATWRGAGVQHAGAGGQRGQSGFRPPRPQQQRPGALGRQVLHRHIALAKARQRRDRAGPVQQHGLRVAGLVQRLRAHAVLRQALHIGRGAAVAGIDPQGHRRVLVGRDQQLWPGLGPIGAQALGPPGRVLPGGQGVLSRTGHQGLAFTQKAAQHRVDEAGCAWRVAAHRGHSLIDQRVLGIRQGLVAGPQQSQCRQQQGLGAGRRGLGREQWAQHQRGAEVTQRQKGQRLGAWPQGFGAAGQQFGERAPGAHPGHRIGHGFEQARQRGGGHGHRPGSLSPCSRGAAVSPHNAGLTTAAAPPP